MEETTLSAPVETPAEIAPAATEAAPAPAVEGAPVVADQPAWIKALDEAPADELRKHPRFAGVVGSEKQRWRAEYDAQQKLESQRQARLAADQAEEDLARANPVAFADAELARRETKRAQERMAQLQQETQLEVVDKLGRSLAQIPEWQQIVQDPAAFTEFVSAFQGKSNDEVVPASFAAAVHAVASRRATANAEKLYQERIKQEKKAWETEAAASGLLTSARPSLARGNHNASADPEPSFQREPRLWNAWYERQR